MTLTALLCRCTQLRAALAGDSADRLPRWCRRHLAHCDRCRNILAAERDLTRRLRESAPHLRRAAPNHLVPRTLARLAPPPRHEPARINPVSAWLKPAWALTALGLLGLAGWLLRSPAPPASPKASAGLTAPALIPPGPPAPALPALSAALETDPLDTLAARFEDPLQTELNHVLADLRKVGHSLAATFLPERLSLTATPEP